MYAKALQKSPYYKSAFNLALVRINLSANKSHIVRKFIICGESRSISAFVCTHFGYVLTIYLPRLSSIHGEVDRRGGAILRAIDEALKSGPAHRPTGIEMLVGRVNASRIVFRAINQRDLISRRDGEKSEGGRLISRLRPFHSHCAPVIPVRL